MKVFFVLAFCILLSSCATTKIIPLMGSYPPTPIVAMSDKSFEKVWDNIIDFYAQNGIPIKIIDRSSGLIISEKTSLTWSFEDKKGTMVHPGAYVVLEKILDKMDNKPFIPNSVTGEWNVRIKTIEGKTSINVNLYNIEAVYGSYYYSSYAHVAVSPVKVSGRTTGMFEKRLYELMK